MSYRKGVKSLPLRSYRKAKSWKRKRSPQHSHRCNLCIDGKLHSNTKREVAAAEQLADHKQGGE